MTLAEAEIDLRIIKAIQVGDREAFAELYDRHNAWLMAVAYRMLQSRSDAEDLLHDVFLEIWKKSGSYNPKRGSVTSWLAVKIRSRALDRLRASVNLKKHVVDQSVTEMEYEAPNIDAGNHIDLSQARKMLDQLTQVQRTIIELSYFQGYTCQEIANHCQMPIGTVKSGLLRGIKTLRNNYNNFEVSSRVS